MTWHEELSKSFRRHQIWIHKQLHNKLRQRQRRLFNQLLFMLNFIVSHVTTHTLNYHLSIIHINRALLYNLYVQVYRLLYPWGTNINTWNSSTPSIMYAYYSNTHIDSPWLCTSYLCIYMKIFYPRTLSTFEYIGFSGVGKFGIHVSTCKRDK